MLDTLFLILKIFQMQWEKKIENKYILEWMFIQI